MNGIVQPVDVSIVIVNWNAKQYLRDCLRSIYDQTRARTFEIIVVDNDSKDGSADMLREEFPGVHAIINRKNHGFAGGNNQGLKVARGRHALLLNPDTVILDGAIDTCIEYADSLGGQKIGIVGCQVWEDLQTIQRTCFQFPSPLNVLLNTLGLTARFPKSRFFGRADMGWWDRRDERDVDVVSGMFMLVRRDAIEQVGLMDDSYFMYAEEADWCYRFWKAGWKCVFTPRARILHLEGGGKSTQKTGRVSANMYVQLQKGTLQFHRKNRGPISWALAKAIYTVLMPIRSALFALMATFGANERWRARFVQAAAATRYHLLQIEPRR